ncbi:MAG: 50S ribosomal protein L6 [Patescibacteria group bacterium]
MSRIAKVPVPLPDGVTFRTEGDKLIAKGKAGEVGAHFPSRLVKVAERDGAVTVRAVTDTKESNAASGLVRSLAASVVAGAAEAFEKRLEFSGVGYRAVVQGDQLQLSMGYSHPVELAIPQGVTAEVKKNVIILKGPDAQALGQFAAEIRDVRPPEPYKGKGIKYAGEQIRRKAGKAAKGAEGG